LISSKPISPLSDPRLTRISPRGNSLRIKLFGPPSVWRDSQPAAGALAQRRRLALLSVLAVLAPPGRPGVSRERLLSLLWRSDDEERDRAALSQALYALRRDLGADDAITGTGELRLNSTRLSCDYWDFLQALAEGADSAAAECRVAPLMEGLEIPESPTFEFWVEEERTHADRRWAAAAERVASAATRAGDTAGAVRWRRALANADPLSGRTALALAKALEEAGEREAALRHLRVHAALLEQELETAPGPELVAYAEALQRPAPARADAGASRSPTAAATHPAPLPPATQPTEREPAPPPPLEGVSPNALSLGAPLAAASPPAEPPHAAPPHATSSRAAPAPRWTWIAIAGMTLVAAALVVVLQRRRPSDATPESVASSPRTAGTVFAVGRIAGDSLGGAAAGMLATNLARAAGVEVIATARVLELLDGERDALAAIRALGATDYLDGTLLRDGSGYRLEIRRTDLASARLAGASRVEGASVFAVVDRASAELLQGISTSVLQGSIADLSSRSLTAWQLYEQGQRASVDGRRDAAVASLRGALREDSTFAMAALTLASLLGSPSAEYLPLLRQAVRMSARATPAEAAWIRINWLSAMNDPGLGAAVDSMAARYPRDLDVQMMVAGPALFGRADFATALRTLEGVWRADSALAGIPGRTRCYACEAATHLHTVLMHADSLAAAERLARRVLALRPRDGVAWSRLADILERDPARHAELEAVIDSAVAHGEPGAVVWRIHAATRRGDTAAFNRALTDPRAEVAPKDAHWSRSILYRNVGRLDEALREARAYAATIRDGAAEEFRVRRTLEAAVLLDLGRGAEAAAIWDSIARLPRPEWTPSRLARQRTFYGALAATARFEAGDTTGLAALADTLAVSGASSGYVRDRRLHYHVRGLAYLARGRIDAAAAELAQGVSFPSMGFTRTNWYLADALERLGRRAEARRWLAAAARASRDASPIYQNPIAARRRAQRLSGG